MLEEYNKSKNKLKEIYNNIAQGDKQHFMVGRERRVIKKNFKIRKRKSSSRYH